MSFGLFDGLSFIHVPNRRQDIMITFTSPDRGQPVAHSAVRGRTVLFVHAHPDDEAIFTGATMRRLADAGARVVLATATLGGESRIPLRPGETVSQRRAAELEHAAELLGVARLVLLGRRDSGLPGSADNHHPLALVTADAEGLARRLAGLIEDEGAEAVVHDDADGIYGHPDHIAASRIGARAAQLAGVTSYQTTVDRDHLNAAGSHLVQAAARSTAQSYGMPADDVELEFAATPVELAAKRAAMSVHLSQIGPDDVAHPGFDDAYGFEWYLRTGAPGILDELGTARLASSARALATVGA